MTMKRIIVCGSRDFNNKQLLYEYLDDIISESADVEIVSGGCRGADRLAEEYAHDRHVPVKVFPADWSKFGRSAGPIRNKQMLDYACEQTPIVIAFWDGTSRGTANMIKLAKTAIATVEVVTYTKFC